MSAYRLKEVVKLVLEGFQILLRTMKSLEVNKVENHCSREYLISLIR